jgi:oligoendopeptidase F
MAKWNLKEIIEPEGLDNLKKGLNNKVNKFKSYRSKLNENIDINLFNEILNLKEEISKLISRIMSYSYLKLVEDTSNIENNAIENELSKFITELGNEMIFFSLWFKDLSNEKAIFFIKNSNRYEYHLKSIRRTKDYALKEEIEQLINIKDLSGQEQIVKLYDIITNKYKYDFFGKIISLEELRTYTRSTKREERKLAYDLILKKYSDEEAILGELYHSIVLDWYNENVKLRKFKSPINVRNISNDVTDNSVQAMLNSVKKNIYLFHEYFNIKSKIVGYEIDRYDIYADIKNEKKEYDFDKSKKIVLNAYNNFSKEMYEAANFVFENNHIHSEIMKNKRSGAFCLGVTNEIGPYVMLNHNDTLECLFTMMHELGHAIHAILSKNNSHLISSPSLPLAETASIFGEMILSQELFKKSDNETKKSILVKIIDSEYSSIIRQAYFTFFELKAHEIIPKGASIKDLNEMYLELNQEQFGKSFKIDKKFMHEWKYVSHFFHSPFYCYAYAFANLLVLSLYAMYEKDNENFKEKYIKLLSKGSSDSPESILKEIGIDINDESFWDEGFNVIKNQIEELKKLI